jgi:N-acetylglucosamine kinase-like BadF-type ATPase
MILIADSGSTNTFWTLTSGNFCESFKTSGINPYYQTSEEIYNLLKNECKENISEIKEIWFYGAGCTGLKEKEMLSNALSKHFKTKNIEVESDLMAAARALCGNGAGIAAILGTGSNSCYYDGAKITNQISPLGYILGDEGSGAVLGRKLLGDVLKKQLSVEICELFHSAYPLMQSDILNSVYRKPFPNRFLAGFTPFLKENIHHNDIYQLVKGSFMEFFNRNIRQYPYYNTLPVHFTGSIAWHFSGVLKDAASATGCTVGEICQNPMEGLVRYHNEMK